jgi:sulfate adenylyltransferase subunit 2
MQSLPPSAAAKIHFRSYNVASLRSATEAIPLPDSRVLTHLEQLEAESIHIMREVVAETENPVMLYSIGKDSAVMLHLALKAFYPARPPFPLMHVDTRWKFAAMYAFRAEMMEETGMELIVHINADGVARNINPFTTARRCTPRS